MVVFLFLFLWSGQQPQSSENIILVDSISLKKTSKSEFGRCCDGDGSLSSLKKAQEFFVEPQNLQNQNLVAPLHPRKTNGWIPKMMGLGKGGSFLNMAMFCYLCWISRASFNLRVEVTQCHDPL